MKHFMEERTEQLLTHRTFPVWDGNIESDDMISTVAKLTCIFAVIVDFHGIGDDFTNKINEEGSVENWNAVPSLSLLLRSLLVGWAVPGYASRCHRVWF